LDDLRFDLVDIEPSPVVGNFNNDMTAFVIGAQIDLSGFRFSGRQTVFRRLEAMVCRIANHVRQRILDHFKDLSIKLRIRPTHLEIDLLAEFQGKIAHDSR